MRERIGILVLLLACAGCSRSVPTAHVEADAGPTLAWSDVAVSADAGRGPFFPLDALDPATATSTAEHYGKHLAAMGEPSVWAAVGRGETVYRLLWLRTRGNPIAIRITADAVGGHLVVTRLDGDGGYSPGIVDVHRERALTRAEVERIDSALSVAAFDTIAPRNHGGLDGANWIIERAKNGSYRLVERWSPRDDATQAAFVAACDTFLDLAGRDVISGTVY